MGVLTNSIGLYNFDDLRGNIPRRSQQLQIFNRPGIDGIVARKTGSRTGAVRITTHHYVLNWQAARDSIDAYKTLIGADPVTIIQHDVNYGTYLIASVEQVEARAAFNTIGSLVANAQVKQVVAWTIWG